MSFREACDKSPDREQVDNSTCMVVNELLCFVQNNMSCIPFDLLLETCLSFFGEEEIKCAKEMLSLYIKEKEDHPLLKRFCASRNDKVMADIINYMLQTSRCSLPDFLAKDLSRIPPVPVEKLDGAYLFREMQKLHAEISNMKMRMSTADLHRSEITEQISMINKRQSEQPQAQKSSVGKSVSKATYSSIVQKGDQKTTRPARHVKVATPTTTEESATDKELPVEVCPEGNTDNAMETDESAEVKTDGFVLQGRPRKYRRNVVRGTGSEFSLKCRPAPPSKVYIGNLAPDTTVDEIINHAKAVCKVEIDCEQLKAKHDSYSSFVITCLREKRSDILKPEYWPNRAVIRQYYAAKEKKHEKQDG